MFISIIIPAYNEEKSIKENLLRIHDFFTTKPWKYEVLVVNDGSQDKTAQIVDEFSKKYKDFFLISYSKNQGKGFAVKMGMLKAKGEIFGFTDCDGATPIEELDRILPHFNQDADVVIGSRAKFSEVTKVQVLVHRKIIGRIFNFCMGLFVSIYDQNRKRVKDTQCGFKWFQKEAAQEIFSLTKIKGFAFDVEILFLANRLGYLIEEVPVNWVEKGNSKVNLFKDPLKMLWQVITIRTVHRHLRVLTP